MSGFFGRELGDKGSLCISSWLGTHCKEQAGLELVDICQPLLLGNWDEMPESQNLVKSSFYLKASTLLTGPPPQSTNSIFY